jgi:2'-5' RNA ligase
MTLPSEVADQIYEQVVMGTTIEQAPFSLNDEEEAFWRLVADEVQAAREVGYTFEAGLADPDLEPPTQRPSQEPVAIEPDAGPVAAAAVNINPDGTPHTGGMIALVPTPQDCVRLAVPDGEPAEQLHTTLLFLGEAATVPEETRAALTRIAETTAQVTPPIVGQAWAVDYFNPTGDEPCWCLGVGGIDLEGIHNRIAWSVGAGDGNWALPPQHRPWVPHISIMYSGEDMSSELTDRLGPVTFDRIRVAFGTEIYDYPLAGQPVTAAAMADSAQIEEGTMPYGIRSGGADCPHEVYNKDTDKRVEGGCHETRQDALDHQRALQANVPDAAVPGVEAQPGEHFHAVAHIEGQSTGMRTFTNLSWREPPFAFHWQKSSSAHGGTPMTVQAGLVSRVERDPTDEAIIHMFGPLDLESADGAEYARQLVKGFARWVSIGLDEQPAEVEYVWPEEEAADDAEDGPMSLEDLFPDPEQVLIDGGCIGELSGVSVPAQADATIEPTPELVRELGQIPAADGADAGDAAMDMTECPDGQHWDEGMQDCVPDDQPAEGAGTYKRRTMHVSTKGNRVTISGDGTGLALPEAGPGPRTAPSPDTTMADVVQALTAAAYRIEIPDLPPASWYDEPTDVDIPGAFCVTDEGRIYGILAPLNVNHRAYSQSGRRMTVPNRNVDYSRFLGGEAITASGRIAGVGPITMDCGHAPMRRDNGEVGFEHYDNACSVVGKVRVGETAQGLPWVAGALEPGVTPDQVSRMLACRLSGDWQPHSDKRGWMELVAALLVPSPGFPMGRTGPTLTTKEGVLVASSMPVRMVDSHGETLFDGDPQEIIASAAEAAGSGEWARRARRFNAWRNHVRSGGRV